MFTLHMRPPPSHIARTCHRFAHAREDQFFSGGTCPQARCFRKKGMSLPANKPCSNMSMGMGTHGSMGMYASASTGHEHAIVVNPPLEAATSK